MLFFLLADGWVREELDFALNTVRAALGSRLLDERVRGSVREAAEIQQSLLVEEPPAFPGYEHRLPLDPAEEVGGDFYDFLAFDGEMLGLAIGDASGHGLPAALLVRDVVTGLRMGIEKDLKVAHVFGKLNRVIHRSNLSSRFVSVFYGELEADGNLIYVNAGHQPPLLFPAGPRRRRLATGGTVIGPLPEARFRRGFARIEPGEVLVLCTDGILERRDAEGEFFGAEGLAVLARKHMARLGGGDPRAHLRRRSRLRRGPALGGRRDGGGGQAPRCLTRPIPRPAAPAVLRGARPRRSRGGARDPARGRDLAQPRLLHPPAAICGAGRPCSATCWTRRPRSRAVPPVCGSKITLATDRNAVAVVGWSSTYRGRTMQSREMALFRIEEGNDPRGLVPSRGAGGGAGVPPLPPLPLPPPFALPRKPSGGEAEPARSRPLPSPPGRDGDDLEHGRGHHQRLRPGFPRAEGLPDLRARPRSGDRARRSASDPPQ